MAAAAAATGAGSALRAAGRAWADDAGGTSGILWGLLLETLGERLDAAAPLGAGAVVGGLRAAAVAIGEAGKARLGDKTLLDAFWPFVEALEAGIERSGLAAAWREAAVVATEAAAATAGLRPRVGRARPLAERSVGTPDPGAVSFALCAGAVGPVLAASGAEAPGGRAGDRDGEDR